MADSASSTAPAMSSASGYIYLSAAVAAPQMRWLLLPCNTTTACSRSRPLRPQRRVEPQLRGGFDVAAEDRADDRVVPQRPPAVFAALHDRGQAVLGQEHPGVKFLFELRRQVGNRRLRLQRAAVNRGLESDVRMRLLRRPRNRLEHAAFIAADQLGAAVNDRLR